jgi:eukaryotic-like serine/threonine-protein kinase
MGLTDMIGSNHQSAKLAIDEAVERYESTRVREGHADVDAFLPARTHRFYADVLCELLRVDLEYSYDENRPKRLEDYERRFPEFFRDGRRVREVAFEEYRLRLQAGESPTVAEYRDRYGVDVFDGASSDCDPGREYRAQDSPAVALLNETPRTVAVQTSDHPEEFAGHDKRRPGGLRRLRLNSTTWIIAGCLACIATLATGVLARQREIARRAAYESLDRLMSQVKEAEYLLGVPGAPTQKIDEGIALCRQGVDTYSARTDARWLTNPPAALLAEEDRIRVGAAVGKLLTMWARALSSKADSSTDLRADLVAEVGRLVASATASFGSDGPPRGLRLISAEVARLEGHDDMARDLRAEAERIPLKTGWERLLVVPTYLDQGQDREALVLAEEASRLDPLEFAAWLLRGHCLARIGQNERADQCFSIGIDLQPGIGWAYFDRGTIALERKEYDRALADLDRFLEHSPDQPDALRLRAITRLERADAVGAIADLDQLLKRTNAPTVALFIRAQAHEFLGNRAAANADRREGLARVPNDELSGVTRGLSRAPTDPAGALEDFRAARAFNPKSLEACINEAKVLSETLGRIEEAVKALDLALVYHPRSVAALASRSVLLARLGRRDEAVKDAQSSISLDDSAKTLFRAACTFALTSRREASDRDQAIRLLAVAVRKDNSLLSRLDSDLDLVPLRDRPEFQRLHDALHVVCSPLAPAK